MTTSRAFWNRIADGYSRRPITDMDAYEKTLERVRSHLGAADTALELGCGTGTTALKLADRVAAYTGSDISEEMIRIAREKAAAGAPETLSFEVAESGVGAFDGRRFDVVMAFNLLHLVEDLDRSLSEIRGLLGPGGLFISKTPCLGRKWYLRPVIGAMRLAGKAPGVRFLTIEGCDRAIIDAGFEIVETGLYPPSMPSRFVVARKP